MTRLSRDSSQKGLVWRLIVGLALLLGGAQMSHAGFVSMDSKFGVGSITLDTDTGLEWIDPWLPIVQGGSGSHTSPNSYHQVLAELSHGGWFEGYRFARAHEVETLLYGSAGFDPISSQSSATASDGDKAAAANLISFFDSTQGQDYGPFYNWKVLDALYDSGDVDQPGGVAVFTGVYGPDLTGGNIDFYGTPVLDSNSTPHGFWLVRDGEVEVSEPKTISLMLFGVCALLWLRRKVSSSITAGNTFATQSVT